MELTRKYIYEQVASKAISKDEAKKLLLELSMTQKREDIAIIGMSCKFPKSSNINEFWDNIFKMRCCLDLPPKERRELWKNSYPQYFMDLDDPDAVFEFRGYIDDVDKFDAKFFRLSSKEAQFMEPSHRIFLQAAYEAIEDSGIGTKKLNGTKTGVFVGLDNQSSHGYAAICDRSDQLAMTGLYPSLIATRISYMLNLRGKSIVIDTACSSGLVAIHEACQAIINGDCEMALAGGIYISDNIFKLSDDPMKLILTEQEDIKTFDNAASGTIRSEGVGVIFLKPLKKAIKDGDSIYAVIKGSAANNDGTSNGITAPNADAQTQVIIDAWESGGINPETISFIEAHGTGTVLGDPIEIKGITNAFKKYTQKKQFCGISSAKTNIGHTASGAGAAGLIKLVLSLKNKVMPASLNFETPNAYINFAESPVFINDRPRAWDTIDNSPRRCGVSAFGFNGTNCHVVLEEAPVDINNITTVNKKLRVLTISANSEASINQMKKTYRDYINNKSDIDIDNICYTANTGRGQYGYRIAIVFETVNELKCAFEKLLANDLQESDSGIFYGKHKLISNKKQERNEEEITDEEKRTLGELAQSLMKEFISSESKDKSLLNEICSLYIRGVDVEWDSIYAVESIKRVNLPTYSFDKVSYWQDSKVSNNDYKSIKGSMIHPLINKCIVESMYQDIYLSELSVDKHWILSEHNILGRHLVPGTAYIEIVYSIAKKYFKSNGAVQFKDIVFIAPLIVEQNKTKSAQIIIDKNDDHIKFTIATKASDEDYSQHEWVKHAEGKVYISKDINANIIDIKHIEERCISDRTETSMQDKNEMIEEAMLGPRWTKTIKNIMVGTNEVLTLLSLPEEFAQDNKDYLLHPSMLDNAMNSIIQCLSEEMYLPLTYGKFTIYNQLPEIFYSHLRRHQNNTVDPEIVSFDVDLIDMSGRIIGEVRDYSVKKVYKDRFGNTNNNCLFHETIWISEENTVDITNLGKENILVFTDESDKANSMIWELQSLGSNIIEVTIGETFKYSDNKYTIPLSEHGYDRLFEMVKGEKLTKVLHLFTCSEENEVSSIIELKNQQERGLYSLFYIIRSMFNNGLLKEMDVVVVSNNANEITGAEKKINPHNAAILGLCKSISIEYPNISCRFIDIDENSDMYAIVNEIISSTKSVITAFRNGVRLVESVIATPIEHLKHTEKQIEFKSEGVYVITGGIGGIGLEVAKFISGKNKVNIALIGRTSLPENDKWDEIISSDDNVLAEKLREIRCLEAMEANISYYSADVSNINEMRKVFEILRKKFKRINGIIHAAGIGSSGYIVKKSVTSFMDTLLPKVEGTFILNDLTKDDRVDFFIMFSSAMSIAGGAGQGDYVAANSYIDSFTSLRKKYGDKTITINWTSWNQTGMAKHFGSSGEGILRGIDTNDAMMAFENILNTNISKVIIGKIDFDKLASFLGELPIRFSDEIMSILNAKKNRTPLENKIKNKTGEILLKGKKIDDYNEFENKIAQLWAEALGLEEIDIYENFYNLGGDSIVATKLLKLYETEFPGALDITDIFTYPTIFEIAEYVSNVYQKNNEVEESFKENDNDSILSLIESIQNGEISTDNALELINKIVPGGNDSE